MTPEPTNFDDPTLRSALSGLTQKHRASAALRDRVKLQMAAEFAAQAGKAASRGKAVQRARPIVRYLKLAAVIVVGTSVGFVAFDQYNQYHDRQQLAETQRKLGDVPTLWTSMASLHDDARQCADTHPTFSAALDDPAALASEAAGRLSHPVPTPKLAGWSLDAASFCTVFGSPGVRFHFVKGTESVTLVSLPESAWTYRSADSYSIVAKDHAIAGYVKDGGLNCIIGAKAVPADEVEKLLEQVRTQ